MSISVTVPEPTPARVVALASGKGGVGKSTLALALAAAWRDAGHRVALVDLDAQGGATLAAGVRPPPTPLEGGRRGRAWVLPGSARIQLDKAASLVLRVPVDQLAPNDARELVTQLAPLLKAVRARATADSH